MTRPDLNLAPGLVPGILEIPGLTSGLLRALGADPHEEGLEDTPVRVARFWAEFLSPEPVCLKTFPAEGRGQIVVQRAIPFFSVCEHHLLPFFGTATVAYVPKERIVGLSKLARLVDFHARRLQVQERLAYQVALSLSTALEPCGVAVMLKARHLCEEMRGIRAVGTETVVTEMRGCFQDDTEARRELFALLGEK